MHDRQSGPASEEGGRELSAVSYNLYGIGAKWRNVEQLTSEGKLFVGLQETGLDPKEPPPPIPQTHKMWRAEDEAEPKRGVMLLMSKSVGGRQYRHKVRGGSELWVWSSGFPFSERRPGLVGVLHVKGQQPKVIKRIGRFLAKAIKKYDIVFMTDLNARLHAAVDTTQPYEGIGHNDYLSRILRHLHGHIGSYDDTDPGSHIFGEHLYAIDFVIASDFIRSCDPKVRVRTDLIGSDHLAVEGTWSDVTPRHTRAEQSRKLSEREHDRVAARVLKEVTTNPPESIDELTSKISAQIRQAAAKPRKAFRFDETTELRRLRRLAERAIANRQQLPPDAAKARIWQTRHDLQEARKLDAYARWQKKLERLAELGERDPRIYFRESKGLAKMRQHQPSDYELKTADGNTVSGEQAEDWLVDHFLKILSPRAEHDPEFLDGMKRAQEEALERNPLHDLATWGAIFDPFSEEEIGQALMRQSSYTATGPDNISIYVWKQLWQDGRFRQTLTELLSKVLSEGKFPDNWRDSWLIPLAKIAAPKVPKDFRGIALTQCVYRIFMKALNGRLVGILEATGGLSGEQYGFRRFRSTVDAVAAILELVQRRLDKKLETCAVFLDYSTAYDSVNMEALRTALLCAGLPQSLVTFLCSCYASSAVTIKFPSGSLRTFSGTSGLRQGCPLAPLMFSLVIEQLLRVLHTLDGLTVPGITPQILSDCNCNNPINTFFFADDGTMVAPTEFALQQLTNRASKWSTKFGLQLNPAKCVSLRFCRSRKMEPLHIWINDEQLPCQETFKLLGCMVDRKASLKSVSEHRLEQTKKQVDMLTPFCKKLSYAESTVRRRLCKAVVEGSVFFSSELWAWGPAITTARNAVGLMGLRILGLSRQSNHHIGMLEAGLSDIGAVSLAKRMNWDHRISWGKPSPTKALWVTASASASVMGKIWTQLHATNWGPEERERLRGQERQRLLNEWTTENLQALDSTQPEVLTYVTDYWLSEGQDCGRTYKVGAVRALQRLRANAFWFWPRLQHVIGITSEWGCLACQSVEKETRQHFLLQCPAWAAARETHLQGVLQPHRDDDGEESVKRLLGGNSRNVGEWKTTGPAVLAYLAEVVPARTKIIQAEQTKPKPV